MVSPVEHLSVPIHKRATSTAGHAARTVAQGCATKANVNLVIQARAEKCAVVHVWILKKTPNTAEHVEIHVPKAKCVHKVYVAVLQGGKIVVHS